MQPAANLEDGTLLLTVNNRLARELHRGYDREQAAAGRRVWTTPDITPWSAWLRREYEQLLDSGFTQRILLNGHQERLLWEQVVRGSQQGRDLLRPGAAARSAQQAWQLVNDWRLEKAQLQQHGSDETRLYLEWQEALRQRCRREHLMTAAELPALLLEALRENRLGVPRKVELAGFDSLNPVQEQLFAELRQQGCPVTTAPQNPAGEAQRLELADPEDEMRMAASWARQFTAAHPDATVAVVSPALEEQRDALQRIFREVISPRTLLPGQPRAPAFNLSLGRPLAEFPLVADLLIALRLCLNVPLELDDVSTLLRSPFIGGHAEEWDRRAQLDFSLRDDGLPRITRARLLSRAQAPAEFSNAHAPALLQRLEDLSEQLEQLPANDTPNAWAGHLLSLMACLGWPGDDALDSHEYQQAERLRRAVSEFATLGRVQQRMRLPEVLRRLNQLCEETVFQAETPAARIQVLGALEAAGMQFDAVWLLGMDDQTWPPSPSPNPLLPARLQRELEMPHASSERELAFARHLTERLLACAPQVMVSHALQDGDRAQRASPLTAALPPLDVDALGISRHGDLLGAALHAGPGDSLPPPQAVPPQGSPPGGSWLLSAQAACPFQAVGKYRLRAAPLPEPSHAPSPALLGKLVHDLLKRVWDEIATAQHLRSLDDADLLALIEPHARGTLADLGRQRPDVFTDRFVELEVQRLCDLLLDWLDLEKQRALPFQVLHLEQSSTTQIGGLSLRLQADRVDRLDDGRLVIIDYKTGENADARGWREARPTELQVPLYCVEAAQPAAALIGRIHARSSVFRGEAQDEGIVPGIDAFAGDEAIPDWQQLLQHWRTALQQLAAEILAGRADIEPRETQTCTYCELGPLCRISSLLQGRGGEDGDD